MKLINGVKTFGAILIVTATSQIWAQASDPASTGSGEMTQSSQPMSSKAANRQLAKTVRRALAHTKGITMSGFVVMAKGGRVALTGTVPNSSQIPKAIDVAKGVPGVVAVDDYLSVGMPGH